jgi:hypothetical protein
MHSPVSSLAWELWRKNRFSFLLLLGLLALGLAVRLVHFILPLWDTVTLGLAVCAMLVTFLVLFAIFSCTDTGVQISYPPRTFTLPVSTGLLVHGPIWLGALIIALVHLFWAYLLLLPWAAHYPLGAFTVFWIAALVAFQASIWCLSNYPTLLVAALVSLGCALIGLANLLIPEPRDPWPLVCLWGILAISYAAAWVGIARQRRGQWHIPAAAGLLTDGAARALLRSSRLLTTPARAQLWMEWRRNAAAPLVVAGLGLALFLWLLNRLLDGENFLAGGIFSVWLFFFATAVTFWAATSGVLLARDASSNSFSLSPFLAVRPISSGALAWAKIKLSFGLTAIGWLIYGLGVSVWLVYVGRHRALREDEVQVITLVVLGLAWHLIGGLPCWLAGRIPSAGIAGLLLIGAYVALGNTVQYFSEHIGLLRGLLLYLLALGFAAKILLAAWAFCQCYRRRLLRGRAILTYVVLWSFGTACFVAIAWVLCSQFQLRPVDTPFLVHGQLFRVVPVPRVPQVPLPIAIGTAALLFPLARIALAPLAVAAARHR